MTMTALSIVPSPETLGNVAEQDPEAADVPAQVGQDSCAGEDCLKESDVECVVKFENRADKKEDPVRVTKAMLCRGRAKRGTAEGDAFDRLDPGTKVFAKAYLRKGGESVVKMGTPGVIMTDTKNDDADLITEASQAPASAKGGAQLFLKHVKKVEADDAASAFVRLEIKEDGTRKFDPGYLSILRGSTVQFSWRCDKSKPVFAESDAHWNPKEDGFRIYDSDGDRRCAHRFNELGVFHIGCKEHPTLKCKIVVRSPFWQTTFMVIRNIVITSIMLALVVVAAALGVEYFSNSAIVDSVVDCSSLKEYCGIIAELKDFVFNTAAVPLVIGTLIFALYIPAWLLSKVWPGEKLSSFGRGYNQDAVWTLRTLSGFFLLLPITLLVLDWAMNVLFTQGLYDFLHLLEGLLMHLLDELFTVLRVIKDLMSVASELQGVDTSSLSPEMLAEIIGYEEMARAYGQLGVQSMVVLCNVRLLLDFWACLLTVMSFAYGVAGVLRRSPDRLRSSYWMAFLSLFMLLYGAGLDRLFDALMTDTFRQYVDKDGNIIEEDGNNQSLVIALLSMCNDPGGTSAIPYQSMLAPLNDTLAGITGQSCSSGHCINFANFPQTPADAFVYLDEVQDEIKTIRSWMSKPGADASELGLGSLSPASLKKTLDGAVQILQIVFSLLKCEQIRPYLNEMLYTLNEKVIPYMHSLVFVEIFLAVTITLWAVLARTTAYVLDRPRKVWFDQVSDRWFRYRFSYKISKKLREESVGDSYFPFRMPKHWFDWYDFAQETFTLNTVVQAFIFIAGCMILAANHDKYPTGSLVFAAGVLSIASTLFGIAGSWSHLGYPPNIGLRAFGNLLCAGAMGLLIYSAFDCYTRTRACFDKMDIDPTSEGPLAASIAKLNCTADVEGATAPGDCVVRLAGLGLKEGDLLAAVPSELTCAEASAATSPYMSRNAAIFGRTYAFANGSTIPAGSYTMCWCGAGGGDSCDGLSSFTHFSGTLYVDTAVDKFDICSLETIAGFGEAMDMSLSLLLFYLVRLLAGFACLFKSFYSCHLTDRQRRTNRRMIQKTHGSQNPKRKSWEQAIYDEPTTLGKMRLRALRTSLPFCIVFLPWTALVVIITVTTQPDIFHGSKELSYFSELVVAMNRTPCAECCNLQKEACGKRVDELAFATAHNAMSSRQESFAFANNLFPMKAALDAGIRSLMLDVHYDWLANATASEKLKPTQVYLCHGPCNIGKSTLAAGLFELKTFLDNNPREVVVIIFEQYVATYSIVEELQATGLVAYCNYSHPNDATPWPTLQELIDAGQRLLIFATKKANFRGDDHDNNQISVANVASNYLSTATVTWWHYAWDYLSQTNYHYEDLEVMANDCALIRGSYAFESFSQQAPVGSRAHRLMILNHFISDPLPNTRMAKIANTFERLAPRFEKCKGEWGHQPNFVAVDFWSLGDVVNATMYMNDR